MTRTPKQTLRGKSETHVRKKYVLDQVFCSLCAYLNSETYAHNHNLQLQAPIMSRLPSFPRVHPEDRRPAHPAGGRAFAIQSR